MYVDESKHLPLIHLEENRFTLNKFWTYFYALDLVKGVNELQHEK
jgi:hypothetical protein